ncbi:MAG TPA: dephospho-CoA kinase [Thermoleophilaceae bacterium]|nr:dephospho-CoA kinase [Thermoleophilaceae bacterium]
MTGPAARVPFVGLTGGLGAGKSTALAAFADLGAATLSTDEVVHELLTGGDLRDEVVARLGDEVASPDGGLDRAAIASRVFESPEDREWLEGLLWPRVGQRVVEFRAEVDAKHPPPSAAVVEVPLLFEAEMQDAFDHTVAVLADEEVRAERAGGRGHEGAEGRAGRQLSQAEKSQRADFTVRNDGTEEELKTELAKLLVRISPEAN